MWGKIIDLLIDWVRNRPANNVADGLLALRDAMKSCDESYHAYAAARERGEDQAISDLYKLWRTNFGTLDLAVSQVDEVLEIFGPDARRFVGGYLASEMEPVPENGFAVAIAAVQVGERVPSDVQQTTGEVDFPEALDKLDAFIREVYSPPQIAAARARLRGSLLARG